MTIANSGLYYLFAEQAMYKDISNDGHNFASYRQMCERNLNVCIKNTPLFTSDTARQVQALLLSVCARLHLSIYPARLMTEIRI
jgi:hypothetical protein